jgi:hypothetical protein
MKQPVKELQAFIDAGDGDAINDSGDLISFKVSCESGLCKSAMRKLEAKYLGEHNLVGKWVTAGFGVKLASGTYETIDYGSFLVSEQTVTKDTGVTEIVAYDKMINAMEPYNAELFKDLYTIDLYAYTEELCKACGLELYNDSFPVNGDWLIEGDLWENINGITYRDIFVQIAQATATTCIIHDDQVYFKPITATLERLTYDNMLKLKLEPLYGEINSVVLSRAPQEDNVYYRDEESVALHGLTEFRIENNEILDKDRESAIEPIFDELLGVSFYPFETTTEGLGWYEIGDHFTIENDTGGAFPTTLFNYSITIDGGIKETLKTTVESKAQTQYQYAKSLAKRVKNAEIIVNKQEQYIKSVVSDKVDDLNEKYTEIYQDIDRIEQRVQNSGGSNLLKNSVMFSLDNNSKPHDWSLFTDGITVQDDAESLHNGGISGRSFTLTSNEVTQKVGVRVSTEADPATYSFSIRIKKGEVGSCSIAIYNDVEEYEISLAAGESSYYGEYVIEGLRPQMNYYSISIGVSGGTATFTDCMFASGANASKWTQANGEVMNTQVCVSIDGVVVKRGDGDYTAMTPLEFAGYANIGGTLKRVFSLNKDVTLVNKLEAEDEIKMGTIKIVPINSSSMQGWAFVPSTSDGGNNGGGESTNGVVVAVAEDAIEIAHHELEVVGDTLIIAHHELEVDGDTLIIK